jgi:hypothetical protein
MIFQKFLVCNSACSDYFIFFQLPGNPSHRATYICMLQATLNTHDSLVAAFWEQNPNLNVIRWLLLQPCHSNWSYWSTTYLISPKRRSTSSASSRAFKTCYPTSSIMALRTTFLSALEEQSFGQSYMTHNVNEYRYNYLCSNIANGAPIRPGVSRQTADSADAVSTHVSRWPKFSHLQHIKTYAAVEE